MNVFQHSKRDSHSSCKQILLSASQCLSLALLQDTGVKKKKISFQTPKLIRDGHSQMLTPKPNKFTVAA
jgi:hypothetical protein